MMISCHNHWYPSSDKGYTLWWCWSLLCKVYCVDPKGLRVLYPCCEESWKLERSGALNAPHILYSLEPSVEWYQGIFAVIVFKFHLYEGKPSVKLSGMQGMPGCSSRRCCRKDLWQGMPPSVFHPNYDMLYSRHVGPYELAHAQLCLDLCVAPRSPCTQLSCVQPALALQSPGNPLQIPIDEQ